jgi:UDP-N-acetylglucosamine--N-acetylmuramyl-(pentapeptide) pyrophosphoryl-undecaprenol N-acetylglucosamine transferase
VPDHPTPSAESIPPAPPVPLAPRAVFIACGGTGGHLFPGLAVARALANLGIGAVLGLSPKAVDRVAVRGGVGFPTVTLPARPPPRPWSPAFPAFLASLWRTARACDRAWAEHQIGAFLGMGGFTTLVPAWRARRRGLPLFLHDSNALPGKANRWAARWADTFFTGLPVASAPATASWQTVGTPVRADFDQLPTPAEARRRLDLDPALPTVLVFGGSQGSRALNEAALDALALFEPGTIQALVIAGPALEAETRARAAKLPRKSALAIQAFCHDMPAAYAAADLALARAGASSLSELAHCGVPAVLVPYPHAADDHQTANARVFADAGAAHLLPQAGLAAAPLAALWRDWLTENRALLSQMASAMRSLAKPDAAGTIARHIAARLR